MKILYAVQGTGNGHLSRALDIVPHLQRHGEVDVLVSGTQGDIELPFEIKYKFYGLSFIFGKSGGVNFWKTMKRTQLRRFIKSMNSLPVEDYDIVINDFEPVSAWACYFRKKPCIALSHQAAVLNHQFGKPEKTDKLGKLILETYAPSTAQYGFHFWGDNENIFTPVIRRQVREQVISNEGHYTVYLPAYDDKRLIKKLSRFEDVQWEVFSKHNDQAISSGNISIEPINNGAFTQSMARSAGVLCGAGFETPAEALYLGKKLLVVPMKGQYEQQLNAAALKVLGVTVLKDLKTKRIDEIQQWLDSELAMKIEYPDITKEIINKVLHKHAWL